jgi:uncharacterized membrane protein
LKLFRDAKGWQLFLVLIGYAIGVKTLTAQSTYPVAASVLAIVVFWALYAGWLWAIASEANRRLDPSLQKSPKWMIIGLAYAVLYMFGGMIFLSRTADTGQGIPGFIFPLHVLAMFGIFYAMAFTAKRLITLERQQEVTFFDYSGAFFLFWFFPIGVWIIQPRVNKLLGSNDA